jgi:Circularly permutated YpsA SLOG family
MKIVSGGQSGVDRAALDAAITLGLAYGGWCPKGGWAGDRPDPPGLLARYPLLAETPSAEPAERTRWNVRDSDATLILLDRGGLAVSGGKQLANATADDLGKPCLVLDVAAPDSGERLRAWLAEVPAVLGIGGPRESEAPGIYEKARALLAAVLGGGDSIPSATGDFIRRT